MACGAQQLFEPAEKISLLDLEVKTVLIFTAGSSVEPTVITIFTAGSKGHCTCLRLQTDGETTWPCWFVCAV